MFNYEFLMTLMVGAMSIPALALLVIASATTQVAPHHAAR